MSEVQDTIKFAKVVGSGNDFIIIDNRGDRLKKSIPNFSRFAKTICERKNSIGSDGLLVLEDSKTADLKMRIFNPDGSEVTMCGNGARCSALYAFKNEWCSENITMETGAGIIKAQVSSKDVRLAMTNPKDIKLDKDLGLGNTIFKTHFIDTGVPHVVHFLNDDTDIKDYPVKETGKKVRYHKTFEPEGTNANFVKLNGKSSIHLRTYERGVEDETLACGTGAVASAIVSHLVYGTEQPVEVITISGDALKVYFKANGNKVNDVYLEGPAKIVYEGIISI
ncbi:MAG: diaminopimelate epimerase [Candidatus Omnitrophica bacterium]|nr:diaminopimelate epimerase [Candidatus Omnitrophota bacterium]